MEKYYKILNLNTNASKEDIRNAYKKLALLYHPDKNNSVESKEKFNEISNAYEILYNKKVDHDIMSDINNINMNDLNININGLNINMNGLTKVNSTSMSIKTSICINNGKKIKYTEKITRITDSEGNIKEHKECNEEIL